MVFPREAGRLEGRQEEERRYHITVHNQNLEKSEQSECVTLKNISSIPM